MDKTVLQKLKDARLELVQGLAVMHKDYSEAEMCDIHDQISLIESQIHAIDPTQV
jgi:hypothetical protein